MGTAMKHALISSAFATLLFIGMILLLELGRQLGRRRQARDEERARAGLGAVEGAVFALLGLLIAFTFSGAAQRFDTRRQMIVEESNAIGTAWLRLDLLPAAPRAELKDLLRRYLDARLEVYQHIPNWPAVQLAQAGASALQGRIWDGARIACQESGSPLTAQLIPALNDMFDIASARMAAAQMHPPIIVFVLLGLLALMSSLLAGYAMAGARSRSWIHIVGFALIMATTVFVILDLEFPRVGFIRVNAMDRVLIELRESMN